MYTGDMKKIFRFEFIGEAGLDAGIVVIDMWFICIYYMLLYYTLMYYLYIHVLYYNHIIRIHIYSYTTHDT